MVVLGRQHTSHSQSQLDKELKEKWANLPNKLHINNTIWCYHHVQSSKLIGSWGRRSMAVAGEVTWHGWAHPYSWSITIVSLRSKKVRKDPQKWVETELLRHVPRRQVSARARRMPVLFPPGTKYLWGLLRKYVELSPSTPPFLIPQERSDTDSESTPNPADTLSTRAYSVSPLKVIRVTWVSRMIL